MLFKQSQKNAIHAMIERSGLSPSRFVWQEKPGYGNIEDSTRIILSDTPYYFKMDSSGNDVLIEFSPGVAALVDYVQRMLDFPHIQVFIANWLNALVVELKEPDKWAEVYHIARGIELVTDQVDNTPFSRVELLRLEASFADFKKQLTAHANLQAAQLRVVNGKLDYLMAKAKDMGKMDWRTFAYGAFMELLIHEHIPQDAAQVILGLLKGALEHVLPQLLN